MKRFLFFALAVGFASAVFSCSHERSVKPAPVLPPVHPAGLDEGGAPPPEIPETPKSVSAQEFAKRQVFSVLATEVAPSVMKLASSVVGGLSFSSEHGAIVASYPAVINQVFGNFSVNFVQSLLPYSWRPILDVADRNKPVAMMHLDASGGGRAYVVGFSMDVNDFDTRLRQGNFGKFAKIRNGGWILPQYENKKVYFAVEENYLFLATEMGLLAPGAAFLRERFGTVTERMPVIFTLHNVAANAERYVSRIAREMNLSKDARAKFALVSLPEFSSLSEISIRAGLDSDLSLQVETAGVLLPQAQGQLVRQLLTPADVADLARVLPASAAAFSLDKLAVPVISAFYRDLRKQLQMEIGRSPQSDESKVLVHFDSVLDWMDQMYDRSADSQAFFVSLHKNRMHAGALLQLRSGIDGRQLLTDVEKNFKSLNPHSFVPTLSPEGKKELAWLVKFLDIRTQATMVDKQTALVVKLSFDWNKMPKEMQDEKTIIVKHFLGKSQEIAFVLDNDALWVMAGANWKEVLKESSARAGKMPNARIKTAGVLSVAAWDLRQLMVYAIGEFLQIPMPSPLDAETVQQLKAARAAFEKFGYGWMSISAGRLDESRIGVNFSMERDTWPMFFAWFLISKSQY